MFVASHLIQHLAPWRDEEVTKRCIQMTSCEHKTQNYPELVFSFISWTSALLSTHPFSLSHLALHLQFIGWKLLPKNPPKKFPPKIFPKQFLPKYPPKKILKNISPKKFLPKNASEKFPKLSKKIQKISQQFLKKIENIQFPTSHLEDEIPFVLVSSEDLSC